MTPRDRSAAVDAMCPLLHSHVMGPASGMSPAELPMALVLGKAHAEGPVWGEDDEGRAAEIRAARGRGMPRHATSGEILRGTARCRRAHLPTPP